MEFDVPSDFEDGIQSQKWGPSCDLCNNVSTLWATASNWKKMPKVEYDIPSGPDSNSVARYLGSKNVANFQPVPTAPNSFIAIFGWNKYIPDRIPVDPGP